MLALYSIVIGLYCHWLSLYFIGLYWAAKSGIVSSVDCMVKNCIALDCIGPPTAALFRYCIGPPAVALF